MFFSSYAAQEMEERERKARQKMEQVNSLVDGWKQAAAAEKEKASAKKTKGPGNAPPGDVDDEAGIFDTDVAPTSTAALFDESDDEDDAEDAAETKAEEPENAEPVQNETEKDLFGDSSSDEDDEDKPKKRKKSDADENKEDDAQAAAKKAKVDDDEAE